MSGNNNTISAASPSTSPVSLPPTTAAITTVPPTTVIETTTSFSTASIPPPSSSFVTSTTPVPISSSIIIPGSTISSPASQPLVTSVVVQTQSSNSGGTPVVIFITTTQQPVTSNLPASAITSARSSSSSTTSGATALPSPSGSSKTGKGLAPGGKIAVAVVVPIAAVALIVLALLFLWRKRKQRKDAEESRRKEIEEYGFNPNNDPTLPAMGGMAHTGDEGSEMREADGAGYRGWGTTSTNRKASTTLSNGNGPIGVAISDNSSNNGGRHPSSPSAGTGPSLDVQSGDPLMGSPNNGRPTSADSETIGDLGAAPDSAVNRQERDIHRGPSNASSAYSGANRSEGSSEIPLSGSISSPQYYNEGMYDESPPQLGPYGDGSYGGGQPVIRDVSARRNTRIEGPSVYASQGNAGIAQNF